MKQFSFPRIRLYKSFSVRTTLKVHAPKSRRKKGGKRRYEVVHPMLKIFDTAKFLLNSEKYSEKILNYAVSQENEWSRELAVFWEKWRCIEPWNEVYSDHANELDHCIPCMLHGDEGVGHRRKPLLQLSWGSMLRIGCGSLERMFLITSCPHKMYSKFNKGSSVGNTVIDKLLEECARSALMGYTGIETNSGHRFYLVFLGLAGDHPFQTKAYRSTRGHLKVDICPHCHANTYSVPFEDVSLGAMWRLTVFQSLPWRRDAPIPLALMPGANRPSFIRWDLMHMLPHGCARNFVASVICMMAGPMDIFLPGGDQTLNSKEHRLEEAHTHFQSWLDCTGQHARDMKDFSLDNLGWRQNRSYPEMTCKASDCNLLIKWLIDYLTTTPLLFDWVLETTLAGLQGLDEFMRLAYSDDRVFWNEEKQEQGKICLGMFLHSYVQLQRYWYERGWTFFKTVPKKHYSAHWHHDLWESLKDGKQWALSPGAFSTPILEDFIGVVCRISRTAHPSSVARTTIFKYLVQVRKVWAASKKIKKTVCGKGLGVSVACG